MKGVAITVLLNDEILDLSKLKAFSDDKSNVIQDFKIVLGRVENIVGKGENVGYQHFLLFLPSLQKPSFWGSLKFGIVWWRVYQITLRLIDFMEADVW